jgi:RNA polymerase sigma-70 factor, ECF subfamily
METTTDQHVERAAEGDEAALVALLEEHGPRVRGAVASSINRKWRSVLDDDDVMQVTYLEAVTRIGGLRERSLAGFIAWLKTIAENNLRDAIRGLEAAKRPDPSKRVTGKTGGGGGGGVDDSSYVALVEVVGATMTTPSMNVAAGEARSFMDEALSELPEDYARVIRLYDLEQRAVEEVMAELGRSKGAVYMLRARAHDALRDRMGRSEMFFSRGS